MSVIQSLVSADDDYINGLLDAASSVADTSFKPTIGLGEGTFDNVQIKQGDLVLDPSENTVYIATGSSQQGKPIVANKTKKKVLEPELLVVGAMATTPALKRAAALMATKYPDRRILVYGDAPPRAEEPVEDLSMSESTSLLADIMKKAENPKTDQPLPTKDEHVRPAGLKVYMDNIKSKKDKTSTGSTVKNEPHPWIKFIKAAGATEDGTPGDANPGNEYCPSEAKDRGLK